jgi:hypothetical protein
MDKSPGFVRVEDVMRRDFADKIAMGVVIVAVLVVIAGGAYVLTQTIQNRFSHTGDVQ